jgi:hypothetical protein
MIKCYFDFIKENNLIRHLNREEIIKFCDGYGWDYHINVDGTVDVYEDVDISFKTPGHLPFQFGTVEYEFGLSNNSLTSLKGCPHTVGGDFHCDFNMIESLEGGPKVFKGSVYNCRNNNIKSFEGFPELFSEHMVLECRNNPIYSFLDKFPDIIKAIPLLNEWEVIDVDKMEVSYLRLSEVYEGLGLDITPMDTLKLHRYTIVD